MEYSEPIPLIGKAASRLHAAIKKGSKIDHGTGSTCEALADRGLVPRHADPTATHIRAARPLAEGWHGPGRPKNAYMSFNPRNSQALERPPYSSVRSSSLKGAIMVYDPAVQSNTELVREYIARVFNEHNLDQASAYLAPEVKWHGGTLGTIEGRENVTQMLRGFIGALPDLHAAEQDVVAEGDSVAVRYVVEATHQGNLLGIAPTGRRVRWDAVDIYRLNDGMIVEEWAGDDTTAILYQVGAYTPPWLRAA